MDGFPEFFKNPVCSAPKLVILRQPQKRGYRFRYKSEGTKHGPIRGESCASDKGEDTYYPTIQLLGHKGPAKVLVTLVTDSESVKAHLHAHTLIVNKEATQGYHVYPMDGVDPVLEINNLAIEHVVKENIVSRLMDRILTSEFLNNYGWSNSINNFGVKRFENLTSFTDALKNSNEMMDRETNERIVGQKLSDLKKRAEQLNKTMAMNKCRLSFQVFLKGDHGHFSKRLDPVYSDVIFDGKTKHGAQLRIMRISKVTSSVNGDEEVWLIADKLNADDIEVRFFEDPKPGQSNVWEAFGTFQKTDVYKQVCLVFRTPEYHDKQIAHSVTVNLELRRKSDHSRSEPQPFKYTSVLDRYGIGEKRKKELPMDEILSFAQSSVAKRPCVLMNPSNSLFPTNIVSQEQKVTQQNQTQNNPPSIFMCQPNSQPNSSNVTVSLNLASYQNLNLATAFNNETMNWINSNNTRPVFEVGGTSNIKDSNSSVANEETVKEEKNACETEEILITNNEQQAERQNNTYYSNLLNDNNSELSTSVTKFIKDLQSNVNE